MLLFKSKKASNLLAFYITWINYGYQPDFIAIANCIKRSFFSVEPKN
ncbi:hypothetical protein [Providencia manganoxydans]